MSLLCMFTPPAGVGGLDFCSDRHWQEVVALDAGCKGQQRDCVCLCLCGGRLWRAVEWLMVPCLPQLCLALDRGGRDA